MFNTPPPPSIHKPVRTPHVSHYERNYKLFVPDGLPQSKHDTSSGITMERSSVKLLRTLVFQHELIVDPANCKCQSTVRPCTDGPVNYTMCCITVHCEKSERSTIDKPEELPPSDFMGLSWPSVPPFRWIVQVAKNLFSPEKAPITVVNTVNP